MENLIVYRSIYPKIRYGSYGDGGYVIIDISGYDALISCGIADNIDFEIEFLKNHPVPCIAFDGTVNGLPIEHPSIQFNKLNINSESSNTTTNLHKEIEPYQNIFLKMDIETFEFRWLHTLTEQQLQKYRQIVIEFHFPFSIHSHANLDIQLPIQEKMAVFEKLAKTHTLVHFHGNNCCGIINYGNVIAPNVFECTYVRKDIQNNGDYNKEPIPSALDRKNINNPEICLSSPPFCFP